MKKNTILRAVEDHGHPRESIELNKSRTYKQSQINLQNSLIL